MAIISIIAICISAIATTAISIYAGKSHTLADKNYQLAQEIKKANELRVKVDDEFRQQVSDLYTAMVISNIYSSDSGLDDRIHKFEEAYKGKVPIPLKKGG